MDDMDDPDFRAAVEASRREHGMHPSSADPVSNNDVVDLTNDSGSDSDVQEVYPKSNSVVSSETDTGYDNDELERALAMSMEVCGKSTATAEVEPAVNSQADPPVRSVGLSGMDRKQMEQERLARLAKRKAEGNVPTPPAQFKRKAEDIEPTSPAQFKRKARATEAASSASREPIGVDNASQLRSFRLGPDSAKGQSIVGGNPRVETRHHATTPMNFPQMSTSPKVRPGSEICRRYDSNAPDVKIWPTSRPLAQWPLGAVKKTHLAGFPRVRTEITIEEVIQREDLELGVFSSFLWDMEWFFRKLNTASSRLILMMQAKEQETKDEYLRDVAGMPNLRLCFPPMEPQVSCMHSKLMLLFHRDSGYLRIVVPTANLTLTDWGENGLMENTVFLIDLPKIRDKSIQVPITPFYEDLVYFLKASTLNQKIIDKLKDYDFTETKRYAFVHSIGGSNTGEKWRRTGYSVLGRAVRTLGLASDSSIRIDYVTSSMGSLNAQFLRAIYLACKGDDGFQEYNLRAGPRTDMERKRAADILNRETLTHFRVYFPSDRTVKEAHENPIMTAGTICFNPKWWCNETFPRDVLYDCESERGVLMHNKIAFVYPAKLTKKDETERPTWAYVGSANLSESAWGRVVKERTTNELKMNCRNWECGVIVPITNEKSSPPEGEVESVPLPVTRFQDIVPVPMRVPATQLSETRRPFFYGV